MSQLPYHSWEGEAALPAEACDKCGGSTAVMGHIGTSNRIIKVVFKEALRFYHGTGSIKLKDLKVTIPLLSLIRNYSEEPFL